MLLIDAHLDLLRPYLLAAWLAAPAGAGEVLLCEERFEDTAWETRGWYDTPRIYTTVPQDSATGVEGPDTSWGHVKKRTD